MRKPLRAAVITAVLALALTAVGTAPASAKTADTGTVAITVTTPGGTPIPQVDVSVSPVDVVNPDYLYEEYAYGDTNASGTFTTGELAPGTYTVTARLWGAISDEKVDSLTVTANVDGTKTLTLDAVQAIKGTVKASGKNVTEGTVTATAADATYYADVTNGSYLLLVKPNVSYTVQTRSYSDKRTWLPTYAGNTVRREDAAKVKPTTTAATANIAVYDKVGKITGRVVDAAGKPSKGTSVSVSAYNRAGYGWATTDSKGNFTVWGLPADTYYVASGTTTASAEIRTVKVTAGATTKANIKLKKHAVHKGKIVLTLKAPAAMVKAGDACASVFDAKGNWARADCLSKTGKTLTFSQLAAGTYKVALPGANTAKTVTVKKDKTSKVSMTRTAGTTLSGKITDSKGKAVKDAWVGVRDTNDTWLNAYTNSKGVYKVTGVTKGAYVVESDGAYNGADATTTKKVTLKGAKATVNIKLIKGATLTGKVVNSKGKGVAGVQVSVGSGKSWATATTDSKGVYNVRGLLGGTYKLVTYDPYDGGYFHGKSSAKSVSTGKTATVGTIKLKG